jgi:hypothetical protein
VQVDKEEEAGRMIRASVCACVYLEEDIGTDAEVQVRSHRACRFSRPHMRHTPTQVQVQVQVQYAF